MGERKERGEVREKGKGIEMIGEKEKGKGG